MKPSSSTTTISLYFLSLCFCLYLGSFSVSSEELHKVVDLENPVLQFGPSILSGNASLGLCQCGKDDWKPIQNGQWNVLMSPYQDRYVDLRFMDGVSGSVEVSVKEEVHKRRLFCLAFGFVLLLLAPFLSEWVPFYYSSSMAVGVLLVVLLLLFQVMKLISTSRKSAFYAAIYGSVIGLGSFVIHNFSMLVNSILVSFGLSEDMYDPVSIFLLVGVHLAGARLSCCILRKFVISDNGGVDVNVAQFVKWAMRVVAVTLIFQIPLYAPFTMVALASCWGICFSIMYPRWPRQRQDNTRPVSKEPLRPRPLQKSLHVGNLHTKW